MVQSCFSPMVKSPFSTAKSHDFTGSPARIRGQTLSTTCAAWGPGTCFFFLQWEHCGDDEFDEFDDFDGCSNLH